MILDLLFVEGGNYDAILYFFILILLGPPALLALIGFIVFTNKKRKAAKVLFILSGVYLVIGLGICGMLMSGF
ncbi:hypothetical protein [Aquimarina pacifica]|uniref:hypothetical protein n=1 Tax=Aquimarina pacifica TaxID=1296415 RepID=UPI0004718F89|nr:hypothetical protein [Aquimarina pacifica]